MPSGLRRTAKIDCADGIHLAEWLCRKPCLDNLNFLIVHHVLLAVQSICTFYTLWKHTIDSNGPSPMPPACLQENCSPGASFSVRHALSPAHSPFARQQHQSI